MHISWARLASFCHLGFISDPLIVSKFHNETHDPKGQENKIYTIVKGSETFHRRHTVPVTSCSEVKYVLKRVSFGSKDCTKLNWYRPRVVANAVFTLSAGSRPICQIPELRSRQLNHFDPVRETRHSLTMKIGQASLTVRSLTRR